MTDDRVKARERKAILRPLVEGFLGRADVAGVIPTPLDQLNQHLALNPVQRLFDPDDMPPGLNESIARLRSKILGAFSWPERSIYLSAGLTAGQSKFTHAHELGHAVIPWHEQAYFSDDLFTLAPETRQELEAEANCFASELIFQSRDFLERSTSAALGLQTAIDLAGYYDTSIHSTVRHYVEENRYSCGLIVFGRYPDRSGGLVRPKVRATVESTRFERGHGRLEDCLPLDLSGGVLPLAGDVMRVLQGQVIDTVTRGDCALTTFRGVTLMRYEVFFNQYSVFALIYPKKSVRLRTTVPKPTEALTA